MGLIALFVFAAHLVLFTGPGLALAGVLLLKEKRPPSFWAVVILFLLTAAGLRIYGVFLPFLDTGKAPLWPVIFSLLVSKSLFYSYLPLPLFWIAGITRARLRQKSPFITAAAAGILLSFPAQFICAFFVNPLLSLLGLQAAY